MGHIHTSGSTPTRPHPRDPPHRRLRSPSTSAEPGSSAATRLCSELLCPSFVRRLQYMYRVSSAVTMGGAKGVELALSLRCSVLSPCAHLIHYATLIAVQRFGRDLPTFCPTEDAQAGACCSRTWTTPVGMPCFRCRDLHVHLFCVFAMYRVHVVYMHTSGLFVCFPSPFPHSSAKEVLQ